MLCRGVWGGVKLFSNIFFFFFFLSYEAENNSYYSQVPSSQRKRFYLLQVSAPLILTGAGFTLHALTGSKRLLCVRDSLHVSVGRRAEALKCFP